LLRGRLPDAFHSSISKDATKHGVNALPRFYRFQRACDNHTIPFKHT